MNLQVIEMYIDAVCFIDELENPSPEVIADRIKHNFNVDVTVEQIVQLSLPEVQEKLAQMKALGINY